MSRYDLFIEQMINVTLSNYFQETVFMATTTQLKIAYIGGGSREWARKLMFDLALCPELTGEVALYDIDAASAQLNEQLGNWLQEQPGVLSRWHYSVAVTLKSALRSADFVVISIQPGTLEIMAEEIAIAERYGMYFPVGDTTGAPGLVRGLRAATIYSSFAEAINTFCPNAWVINYTNPMSICTRTLTLNSPPTPPSSASATTASPSNRAHSLSAPTCCCPAATSPSPTAHSNAVIAASSLAAK